MIMEAVIPYAAMVVVECGEIGVSTLGKASMASGTSEFVFVVYYNSLGVLIFLPYFILHRLRSKQPPMTLPFLLRCCLLGLLGICLVSVLGLAAINYSSPTLGAAMGNLIPAFTFLLAVLVGMEKLDLMQSTCQAKSIGTAVSIAGAFIVTLYKGPDIFFTSSSASENPIIRSPENSNWVIGGALLFITCIAAASWNILQAATAKQYPDTVTIVFFYCLFGTVQCAICSLVAERDPSAWVLKSNIDIIAIVFSAVFACAVRGVIITWCLKKKGPVFVALFKPLSIVIAVVSGVLFLGETFHAGSLIGATIISVGFYTVMWGIAKEKSESTDVTVNLESPDEKTPLLPRINNQRS
uniref:WAT1-related protein n=1 Tax=Kalanchoe fedtschenkoi TaxID=63787 RepID=A0A7N0UMN1_KALFE